ncbi:hypothetical protein PR202_ga17966 [Eleusine coracana subsp. coracana]|uniref:Uncharacterized protein n=1 Tax=Eleusine coracana subsp. coracana TaxID=191504 RepID=A0AAV5CR97_ELECO|nr:hypothetical protein PR202_ga17966 [Eleusine coracana subsp. coracana]
MSAHARSSSVVNHPPFMPRDRRRRLRSARLTTCISESITLNTVTVTYHAELAAAEVHQRGHRARLCGDHHRYGIGHPVRRVRQLRLARFGIDDDVELVRAEAPVRRRRLEPQAVVLGVHGAGSEQRQLGRAVQRHPARPA